MESTLYSSSSFEPSVDDAEKSLLKGFYREALHITNGILIKEADDDADSSILDSDHFIELSFSFREKSIPISISDTETNDRDRAVGVALQSWYTLYQQAKSVGDPDGGLVHLKPAFDVLRRGVSMEVASLVVQFLINMDLRQSSLHLATDILRWRDLGKSVSLAEVWEILLRHLLPYSQDIHEMQQILQELTCDYDESSTEPSTYFQEEDQSSPEDSPLRRTILSNQESDELSHSIRPQCITQWKSTKGINEEALDLLIDFAESSVGEAGFCLAELKALKDLVFGEEESRTESVATKSNQAMLLVNPEEKTSSVGGLKIAFLKLTQNIREVLVNPWLTGSAMSDADRVQRKRKILLSAFSLWIAVRQRRRLSQSVKWLLISLVKPFMEVTQALLPSS